MKSIALSARNRPSGTFRRVDVDLDAVATDEGAQKDLLGAIKDANALTVWANSAADLADANQLADVIQSVGKFEYRSQDTVPSSRRGGSDSIRITLSHTKPSGISDSGFVGALSFLKAATVTKA